MKVWLDAHLDPRLAIWLASTFDLYVYHVRELDLAHATDRELFEAARRVGATIVVTKDSDFLDLVTLLGTPPHIIHLAIGNVPTKQLQEVLSSTFAEALTLIRAGEAFVEIG